MAVHAFTIEAGKTLRSIVSLVTVKQADALCGAIPGLDSSPVETTALWDTGATNSGISAELAKCMGLLPVKFADVEGSNGIYKSKIYLLDITLPNAVSVHNIQATEFINSDNTDVIIGMDIITCGDFAVSNYNKETIVSFRIPPQKPPIDFR